MTYSRYARAFFLASLVIPILLISGCGKPQLESIEVEPSSVTVTVGQNQQFQASGRDTKGNVMQEVAFTWSVVGDSGHIDAQGTFTALKPGTVTVTASVEDVQGTATVTVQRPQVAEVVASVTPSEVRVGEQATVTVTVQDAAGKGIAEVQVQAQPTVEGTQVTPSSATTDADGQATFAITAASQATTNRVEFRADEQQTGVEVQGMPGPPATVSLTAEPQQVPIGEEVSVRVTVQDQAGNPVPGAQVRFTPLSAGTTLSQQETTTNAQGQAGTAMRTSTTAGPNQVRVNVAELDAQLIQVQGQAGLPATLQATVAPEAVVVGEEARIEVAVQDQADNPVPDVQVRFVALSEGTTLSVEESTTDAEGLASARVRTSTRVGDNRVRISLAGLEPQEVQVEGEADAPARLTIQAETSDTLAAATVGVTVLLFDAHGNAVPDQPVHFAVSPDEASIDPARVVSDETGTARTVVRTSQEPGDNEVQARVDGLEPVQLTVQGHPPTTLRVTPQSVTVPMRGSQSFRAIAADDEGQTVEVTPEWQVLGETGTIDAQGVFTAANLGSDTVVATYAGLKTGARLTVVPGDVALIEVTPAEATVVSGTNFQFQAEALNTHDYPLDVTPSWEVTNNLGSIDSSGLFTARKAGSGEIIATAHGQSGRATVTVTPGALVALKVSPEQVSVRAGEELQIQASGYDAAGNQVDIEPVWSLTADLGDLDPSGLFRALHAGTGHIRVEAGPIPVVAEIPVEVTAADLDKIEVTPLSLTLSAGEEHNFTATGFDAFNNQIEITPTWHLTAEVGLIDPQGAFAARHAGSAQVQASVGELTGQASVTVKPGELASLTVQPAGPLTLTAGTTVSLVVTGYDVFGNTVALTPEWSQTEPLGSLSSDGFFQAEQVGSGELVARSGDESVAVLVTVIPGKLARLAVSPSDITMQAGETQTFEVTGLDAYDNEVPIRPSWRVAEDIGEITDAGAFTAMKAQAGQVIATAEGISGEAAVTVQPGNLTFLKATPEFLRLTAGETAEIVVIGYDAYGNPVPTQLVWQVTEGMGTITPDGRLTAQKAGEGRVIVVAGHLAAVIGLEVQAGEVAQLQITPATAQVASGQQQEFTVQGFDRGGNPVPFDPLTWELQGEVGTLTDEGVFTASLVGEGRVLAHANSLTVEATVTVQPGEVATLRVMPDMISAVAGDRVSLRSEAFDAAGNVVPTSPAWTIEGELGEVTDDGIFTAKTAGSGEIIATIGEVHQAIEVQVEPGPLSTIGVTPWKQVFSAGDTQSFTATGYDAFGNTVGIEPTWSLQGGIGQIDATEGTFRATTVGYGAVVAVVGTVAGMSPVTVEPGEVSRLQIVPPQPTLAAGDQIAFSVTAFDAFNNITTADTTWELSEPLGQLVNTTFQAERVGTAEIVVSAGAIQVRTVVQVKQGPLVRLEVVPQQLELASGTRVQLRALGYDAFDNAHEVPVIWSLTDDLGELTDSGQFTAGKQGEGQIAASHQGLSDAAQVIVVPGPVQRLVVSPAHARVASTTTQDFTVVGFDAAGNERPVTAKWAMTASVGDLDANGQFTATTLGTGTLVAYTDTLLGTAAVSVQSGPVALLFVTPQPVTVPAGETIHFEARAFDRHQNRIPEPQSHWSVNGNIGTIDPDTGVFTATLEGWGKVQVEVEGKQGSADVVVEPGVPDANKSRLMASRLTVLANGKSTVDIIVQVRDRYGNPVADAQVTLISSRDDMIDQPGLSNPQGIAVGRIRSIKPGRSEVSAVVESVGVSNTLRLTFSGASG